MELHYSDKYFVLQNDNESLWVNRENGLFSTKTGGREVVENNPTLSPVGKVYGFIGTLCLSPAAEPRLVFIKSQEVVCKIKENEIYKVTSVVSLPLESECEIDIEWLPSKERQEFITTAVTPGSANVSPLTPHKSPGIGSETGSSTSWNKVKIPACPNSKKYGGRVERTERRLLDEYYKMFIEADSFYYSNGYDIFNSLQRQKNDKVKCDKSEAIWKEADERFFWNNYMLSDIISKEPHLQKWAIAVMQGSIQHQICQLDPNSARISNDSEEPQTLELILISRRSRHRAGTRYLRRGVDENGNVANYVETEQIVAFRGHMISFVQTRGSVPVFWSQPGYKYRPPIRLDKSIEESFSSFEKHMEEELKCYKSLNLINLVEKTGKERTLEEAYRKSVLTYNSEDITYITFDFHDKCRGLKFENVKQLIENVGDIIKNMAYCWVDSYGIVMQQNGTFRVNCVDCLDRTNVVQSFLAKEVLGHQLSKIGLLLPEVGLSESIRKKFLEVWANNGDIISKQYAGTNALKGDFTRTGERRFAGVMRDGMNSANRYLNNRLKDGTRQACIDLILGVRSSVTEEELTLGKEVEEEKEVTTESIMLMIEDVRQLVVPPQSIVIGSWGLVNAKTSDIGTVDIDTVLILTENECFIAIYDCSLDMIASSTKINLSSISSLEIVTEPVAQHNATSVWGFFHTPGNSNAPAFAPSLKLHFIAEDETHDFFHFRSSNLRFFNNCLTPIGHPDEMMEALKILAENLKASVFASCNKTISVIQAATPTPVKVTQRGIPGINAWIPRWNTGAGAAQSTTAPQVGEPSNKKFSPASMQRFTPSFLKKKRTNPNEDDGVNKMDMISVGVEHALPIPGSLKVSNSFVNSSTDPSALCRVSQQQARTPMESGASAVREDLMDWYLPTCGIVSIPVKSAPLLLHSDLRQEVLLDENKTSPRLSPVTPIMDATSQDVTPTSSDTNPSWRLHIPQDLFQRHRFSLPTNSLSITSNSPSSSQSGAGRSTTPEIRITEEPSSTQGDAPIPTNLVTGGSNLTTVSNQKRMSRSSEDINKATPATPTSKIFNTSFMHKMPAAFTFKQKLAPTLPQDSRSNSDQDIFASLQHMKGSHSESAIKDGAPVQKKDVVFAPLGKLARGMQNIGVNYLDPRKLRDSLRQPRQENAAHDDPEIMELMKTCKSRIIDI